jgi:hypothetical protein
MWDNETTFSNRQPLAEGASENIVDAGPGDIGAGEPVILQVSLSPGASGALTVTLETAKTEAMTAAVERVRWLVDAARAAKGGTVLAAPLPTGCDRYLRLRYSGATGGTVTAGLVQAAQTSGMLGK